MLGYIKSFSLIFSLLTYTVFANEIKNLELKPGLWEGIRQIDGVYKLIEINSNGQHRMFNLNIRSAFKKRQFRTFDNDDIDCTTSECVITITHPNNDISRHIISPYIENSFKVLEVATNQLGKPVFSQTYQLDKQEKQSTVREFMQMYKKQIESLRSTDEDGINGFWLGILVINEKPELLAVEIHPNSTSHFVRFVNGQSFVNSTSFEPEDIEEIDDVIRIKTKHLTFANKLILHKGKGMLRGYMYSTHKGVTIEKGTFQLTRVK